MLTVIPELDLTELIAYGKSKGVEIVLWTVFNVLDSQLEAACKKYADMGIKGFKVDFLDLSLIHISSASRVRLPIIPGICLFPSLARRLISMEQRKSVRD